MKIDRLLSIVLILLTRDKLTASELAEYFEVSVRTIYRDIESISLAGIPVYAEQGKGGGISLMGHFKLERQFFLSSELNDLIAAVQRIPAITGDSQLEKAVEKMRFLSGAEGVGIPDDSVVACHFSDDFFDDEKRSMETLTKAIRSEQVVEFSYSAPDKEKSVRDVEPLRIIFLFSNWYLQAWCLIRNDYRLFKISRMDALKIKNRTFLRAMRMKTIPEPSGGNSKPTTSIELLFTDKKVAGLNDYFRESEFHESEEGLRICVEWPLDEWVYRFLMGFGPGVLVLSPLAVKEEIFRRHQKALENYSKYINQT
jgi:predicted DNA-binding transcriptional regulator YafY